MSKKFGLGKGLNALIPDEVSNNINSKKENNKDGVALIDINLIKNNNEQPRKLFDDEKILELAESIKHNGIIQPIILRKVGNNYIIVAGERRWRAAKLIGIKEIPSIIMDLTDKQVMEISLIENIQRQDLNSIEEANAYKKLISEFNLTQEELSKRLGKSRTAITNTMRLLNLSEGVKQYLIEGVISEGHGRALLSINEANLQCEVAQKVIDDKLSVRELEKFIKYCKEKKVAKPHKKENEELNPYYKDITERLQGYFGTKVNISNKNNKGKIEIEYYSYEDLQRILDIIKL
ncbi:ParB/RepB/Spo0J family partition protein [uncultured Clostridium sp.]|uniref:ParB/RepB/Spo0J family partition protein n=1 Tax=uncultured Clostridium sp. TaxID=59620 RepID=UPI00267261B9|nr:ParB/RepB/Spo0J family partition protein [uncultured Clostridium sp.]